MEIPPPTLPITPQTSEPLCTSFTIQASMPLPQEAVYSSKEELYSSIQAWAAQYKYAFRIERSTKINRGIRSRIVYSCDRAGKIPPANHPQNSLQHRKRRTSTRKTGCQFSVVAKQRSDSQWELCHRPGAEHGVHNHPPSHSISSHPVHRKLGLAEIKKARSLYDAGIKPGQAITFLREITSTPLQTYDIYNLYASFQRERRHGQCKVQPKPTEIVRHRPRARSV